MNKKDVIYIEPNDDITDILGNIQKAENKIVALVPPKKAGVLRSAVNFKLIAKTAKKDDKAIVLITTDESLLKLAAAVKIPTAKSLQSKPQLPKDLDAEELDEKVVAQKTAESEKDAEENIEEPEVQSSTAKAAARKTTVIEESADEVSDTKEPEDSEKTAAKGSRAVEKTASAERATRSRDVKDNQPKAKKVPDFKKIRGWIIGGALAACALIGIIFWATQIAPAVKIAVHVKATSSNFSERVTFTENADQADPNNGVFFVERKTVKKTAQAQFDATGSVDKGSKASGQIQIKIPKGTNIKYEDMARGISVAIPEGTSFIYGDKSYRATNGGSIRVSIGDLSKYFDCKVKDLIENGACPTTSDITSDRITISANENGESYNISEEQSTKWSAAINSSYKIVIYNPTAITGGSSKIVKQVSEQDVRNADETLVVASDSEMRDELAESFGAEYVLLKNSFASSDAKLTTSPNIGEEVADDVTPKIIKELSYSMLAVSRGDLEKFITAKLNEKIANDQTQMIYSTGVSAESDQNFAFIESYKDENGVKSAKLKSTTKIGPKVDEAMIAEKSYGEKIGKVQTILLSINGVDKVDVERSYPWVMRVPNDENKVQIELTVE